MANDESEASESPFDAELPTEWIETIATAEDIPHDKVIERLVSSYWMLEEIHGVLDQTDSRADSGLDPDMNTDFHDIKDDSIVRVSEDLDEIRSRLDQLEQQVDPDDTSITPYDELQGQLTMVTERVNAVKSHLTDQQVALESRVDDELEYLILILEYLLDTTEALEAKLQTVAERQDPPQTRHTTHEQLVDLQQQASRLGVHTATCEACETSVDIQLLPTPDCPGCDRRFSEIEPASGWFGLGTDTLTVAEEPHSSP